MLVLPSGDWFRVWRVFGGVYIGQKPHLVLSGFPERDSEGLIGLAPAAAHLSRGNIRVRARGRVVGSFSL